MDSVKHRDRRRGGRDGLTLGDPSLDLHVVLAVGDEDCLHGMSFDRRCPLTFWLFRLGMRRILGRAVARCADQVRRSARYSRPPEHKSIIMEHKSNNLNNTPQFYTSLFPKWLIINDFHYV